jgi:hypothetical protein
MDPCRLLGWAGLDCPPAEQGEAESQISSAHLAAALDVPTWEMRGTETLPHGDRGRGGSDDWRPSAVNLGRMI